MTRAEDNKPRHTPAEPDSLGDSAGQDGRSAGEPEPPRADHVEGDSGPASAAPPRSAPTENGGAQGAAGPADDRQAALDDFIARLGKEEKMLVLLQSELYEGNWQAMLTDLQNRLEGKPYIFKLANRIRDDIARIEKLQGFEQQHNVKLADFVEPPSVG